MRTCFFAAAGSLLLSSTSLFAQGAGDPDDVHHRNDCRLALQIVETGHPAPHREWAYSLLPRCEGTAGPAAVAALWNGRRSVGRDEWTLLVRTTYELHDRRILLALRNTAENTGADTDARLDALALLFSYAETTGRWFTPADLRMPADGPSPPMRFVTHAEPVMGAEPAGDVREDLRTLYTMLRDSDPDPVIRNAAIILLRYVPE